MQLTKESRKPLKRIKPERLKLTLLALPFLVFTIMFSYVPLFGWGLAFTNYRPGLSFNKLEFVGLKYFLLIGNYWERILNALRNTLMLSLMGLALFPLPIIFAIMLNELRRPFSKKLVQTIVTLPNFVSWVIVSAVCFGLFSSNGVVNMVLENLGLINEPTQLLTNARVAWSLMTLLGVWKGLGWSSIIYLAAIAGIDGTLYEAAYVDGANRFDCMWYITVPGVLPTALVLLLLSIGNLLSVGFEQYMLFSNSMNQTKLMVLDLLTYRIGLISQDYSFATAIGILRSIVSIILMSLANLMAKKVRGEGLI